MGTDSRSSSTIVDELAELARVGNNFGFIADDHGNTESTATSLTFSNGVWSGFGLIGQNDDVDVFSFTVANAGRLKLDITGAEFGPNLDAVAELRDSSFNPITTFNPDNSLSALVIEHLSAGDYYLTVSSVGTYGWIGQYSITGNIVPGAVITTAGSTSLIQDSLGQLRVVFDAPIDANTFDVADVSISGPTGLVSILDVIEDPASGGTEFDVLFTTQSNSGGYELKIGIDPLNPIRDLNGDALNQDLDFIAGETTEDVFTSLIQLTVPEPGWSFGFQGLADNRIIDMTIGDDGSVYTTGLFHAKVDFDPGPGIFELTPIGPQDGFVAKYTANRELIWAVRFGGTDGTTKGQNLVLDSVGDVYISGWFTATDAMFGSFGLVSNGGNDIFLAKLSQLDGSFVWANGIGSTGSDRGFDMTISDQDQIFLTGDFNETVDFDPGAGQWNLTSGGSDDAFVAEFDSSGNLVFAHQITGSDRIRGRTIAVDSAGDVYLSGTFQGTADFGNLSDSTLVSATSQGNDDAFVVRFNSNWDVDWAQFVAGVDNTSVLVAVGPNNEIYVAGVFTNTISLDNGSTVLNADQAVAYLISRLDDNGNVMWAEQISSTESIGGGLGITVDSTGNLYVYANTEGDSDLDPGPGTWLNTTNGLNDLFVVIVSPTGQLVSVVEFAGTGHAAARAIALDNQDNIFLAGHFDGELITPTGDILESIGNERDSFLVKIAKSPAIQVFPTSGMQVGEDGTSGQFGVRLEQAPTSDVVIAVSSTDSSEGTVAISSLTFTPGNWNQIQFVTVQGVDDALDDDDVTFTVILGPAVSLDSNYDGMDPDDVTVINLGNDIVRTIYGSTDTPTNLADARGNNPGVTLSELTITENFTIRDLDVLLDINHTWVSELTVFLIAPSGMRIELFAGIGGSGDNFVGTHLDQSASQLIVDGATPFTGVFRPTGDLSVLDGMITAGVWGLEITDNVRKDSGDLISWSLDIEHFQAPPNIAPVATDDNYAVDEDMILVIPVSSGVLDNDSDANGDTLAASLVTGAANGSVVLNTDGSFSYTPNPDFYGADSFTYQSFDGSDFSNIATVTITVSPINDAPVATGNNYVIQQDTVLNISAPGVLDNDSDVENDPLTSVLDSNVANGILALNSDGSFDYTSNLGFTGIDTFSYLANDGAADSNIVTVSIVVNPVNDLPIAVSDSYNVDEDDVLNVAAPGTLGNDDDGDNDPLTAILVSSPSNGLLTFYSDGSFVYTPDTDFHGDDSFTYKANDGIGDSNVATVSITVNPINDAPVAAGESFSVDENITLNVAAPGLLINDNDIDGDPLTVELFSDVSNGTLTLNADGSFDYSPAIDFTGQDSFEYYATDGALNSISVTVTIDVNSVDSPLVIMNTTSQAIPDQETITSVITVSEDFSILDLNVEVNITHEFDSDLDVFLIAPDGTRIELFTDVGGGGDNFDGTILDDDVGTLISAGSAPFSGTFRPEGDLSVVESMSTRFNGNGDWTLEITDDKRRRIGTLNSWKLTFEVTSGLVGTAGGEAEFARTLNDAQVTRLTEWTEKLWGFSNRGRDDTYEIRIADLPGQLLGATSGQTITIDSNAAGLGWFVDVTPWENSEFATTAGIGDRYDLLTVLAHELGHFYGHDHEQAGVMAATLDVNTRLLPNKTVDHNIVPMRVDFPFTQWTPSQDLDSGRFGTSNGLASQIQMESADANHWQLAFPSSEQQYVPTELQYRIDRESANFGLSENLVEKTDQRTWAGLELTDKLFSEFDTLVDEFELVKARPKH